MKERSGTVMRYTPGFANTIFTWWVAEKEPGVTQEDEQYGII